MDPSPAIDPVNDLFLREIEALSNALSLDTAAASSKIHRRRPPGPKPKASSSSSIFNWKNPLKSLSPLSRRHQRRRFDCLFSLHVRSIDRLPTSLAGAALSVHWRSEAGAPSEARTLHATAALDGNAEFDQILACRCGVHGTKSSYDARPFSIRVTVDGDPGLDLGEHRVDLARLLPVALDELEDSRRDGQWSTSFQLSGKAKGARLHVSFGFSVTTAVVGSNSIEQPSDRPSLRRACSLSGVNWEIVERSRFQSWSVDDECSIHVGRKQDSRDFEESDLGSLAVDSKSEFSKPRIGLFAEHCDYTKLESCTTTTESNKGEEDDRSHEPEFVVIDRGIEITTTGHLGKTVMEKLEPHEHFKLDQQDEEFPFLEFGLEDRGLPELDSGFDCLSIHESQGRGPCKLEQLNTLGAGSNYRTGSMKSRSFSLDDLTESVANEFFSLLGIEDNKFGSSSDGEDESPKQQPWKQVNMESQTAVDEDLKCENLSEYPTLSLIVHAAEMEHHIASQAMESKLRAKMLVDAETEALMRQWGLDEEAFPSSPHGSRDGFGSPIELLPEEQPELPPLGEILAPVLQMRDQGSL